MQPLDPCGVDDDMVSAVVAKKTPVCLVHGLMGSLRYFNPGTRLPMCDVLTPALHGYGTEARGQGLDGLTVLGQARLLAEAVGDRVDQPCWLAGHSCGGAVAMVVAATHPDIVAGVISIEGNFTLNDAFWSLRISRASPEEWHAEYKELAASPEAWLRASGIDPTPTRTRWATEILAFQSAETIRAMARAIVEATGSPDYLDLVSDVLRSKPVHLLAGERSVAEWDIPDWARSLALSVSIQPAVGHLMMLEDPDRFCELIARLIRATPSDVA
jgi:pimeloyl-ACP methyl ester carboxylesterase